MCYLIRIRVSDCPETLRRCILLLVSITTVLQSQSLKPYNSSSREKRLAWTSGVDYIDVVLGHTERYSDIGVTNSDLAVLKLVQSSSIKYKYSLISDVLD
jgi:hypothetical protein